MDQYDTVCQSLSRSLTLQYSTSFSLATRMFPVEVQTHIFNIYGMVRVADEIVDTYAQADAGQILNAFEARVYDALKTGYSSDVIAHAFQLTAHKFSIGRELIEPFFASMRQDLTITQYNPASLKTYIYGSAEVVGLMCSRVFYGDDEAKYQQTAASAQALGAAYQKVNFLRDLHYDLDTLHRQYFPGVNTDTFDTAHKQAIIDDIKEDFVKARHGIAALPKTIRPAVQLSYDYYNLLLAKLERVPSEYILQHRVRVPNSQKLRLFGKAYIHNRVIR